VHIHVGGSVHADLHLQGPPFGGYADVDFYVCGFTVYFGHQPDPPAALLYADFLNVVKALGPSSDQTSNLGTIAISEGIVTQTGDTVSKKHTEEWKVHPADVVFRVECKIPITTLTYGDGLKTATLHDDTPFFARQMHTITAWKTKLTVTVQPDKRALDVVDEENLWQPVAITRQMPMSVWGLCNIPLYYNCLHFH
jgi:hypothetical protein